MIALLRAEAKISKAANVLSAKSLDGMTPIGQEWFGRLAEDPISAYVEGFAAAFAPGSGVDVAMDDRTVGMALNTSYKITKIDDATRIKVGEAISGGLANDLSDREIVDRVQGSGAFSRSRAKMIARTEITIAQNRGQVGGYHAGGVTEVEVSDGTDFDDACKDANGQIWSARYAGQNATAHPNCTRVFIPVMETAKPKESQTLEEWQEKQAKDGLPAGDYGGQDPITGKMVRVKPRKPQPLSAAEKASGPVRFENPGRVDAWARTWQGNIGNGGRRGKDMADDTFKALRNYTKGSDQKINKTLRGEAEWKIGGPDEVKAARQMADDISNGMGEVGDDVVVVRSSGDEILGGQIPKPGTVLHDDGFMSTSVVPPKGGFGGWGQGNPWDVYFKEIGSGQIRLEVQVPKGTRAIYAESVSRVPGEYEMLLDKGTTLVVDSATKMKGGGYHIKARVVEQAAKAKP